MRYICFTLGSHDYIPCLRYVVEMFYKLCPKGTFTKTYVTNEFLDKQRDMFCNLLYEVIYLRNAMWKQHAESFDLVSPDKLQANLKQYIVANCKMFLTDKFLRGTKQCNIYLDLDNTHLMQAPVIYLA